MLLTAIPIAAMFLLAVLYLRHSVDSRPAQADNRGGGRRSPERRFGDGF